MDPHEVPGVERGLEVGERLLLEVRLAVGVQADVVVLGLRVVELVRRDDVHLRPLPHHDAGGGLAGRPRRRRELGDGQRRARGDALAGAVQGRLDALGDTGFRM